MSLVCKPNSDALRRSGPGGYPLQFCQYNVRVLLLAAVLVALVFAIAPRLVEELDPVETGAVLLEFRHSSLSVDTTARGTFETDIVLASEDRFRLRLWHEQLVSAHRDGTAIFRVPTDQKTLRYIGEFVPDRQLIGHNYKLSVRLIVRDGTVRVGSDEEGWFESVLLTPHQQDRSWNLVALDARDDSHLLGIGVGVAVWQIVFEAAKEQQGRPEQIAFTIWMEFGTGQSCFNLLNTDGLSQNAGGKENDPRGGETEEGDVILRLHPPANDSGDTNRY